MYLDSVFFPLLTEETFLQEGWRLGFTEPGNPDSPLTYNGVVYNEMRGAFSNRYRMLSQKIESTLFPDSVLQYVSGGDPAEIPNLTFAAFKAFHEKYYHPSNAYIYSYGSFPLGETLRIVQENALSEFEHAAPVKINMQQPLFLFIRLKI